MTQKITTRTFSPDKNAHLPVLDGVRGMAVLMVLLFHFWQGMPVYRHRFDHHLTQAASLFSIGQKGVDLFFVLSGFLITGILMRSRGSTNYFKNFYARRSLRIFPLYFVVVLGCLLAGAIWNLPNYRWHNTWWYLCYLQNVGDTFFPGSVAGPGHFWSLAVEEHFYIFWPLAVALLERRKLKYLCLFLIGFCIVVRVVFISFGLDVFTFTFCRMDSIAVGALLATYWAEPSSWHKVTQWTRRLWLPLAILAMCTFVFWSGTGSPVVQTVKYTLFAVLCGMVLVLALSTERWNSAPKLFRFRWLRSMGKTSYAMYVFHPFIYLWIMGRFYNAGWSPVRGRFAPALIIEFVLALTLTVVVSWFSWVALEHPLVKLKRRFQYEDLGQGLANATVESH
jgi:peptidoglycan/LPS O-acetylase OafA/YrhL